MLLENQQYKALPVVTLRVLVQNTTAEVLMIHDQLISVDTNSPSVPSFVEIRSDPRLLKRYKDLSGKVIPQMATDSVTLRTFDSVVLEINLHCAMCSTEAKFKHNAKNMRLSMTVDGKQVRRRENVKTAATVLQPLPPPSI